MNRGEVEELVQTTVRRITSGPDACLTNPRVLSFFNMLKDSLNRCLSQEGVSPSSVMNWSTVEQSKEVATVINRYPAIKDAYMYSAVYIVEQTYKKEEQQLKLKLPSFQQFLYTFYCQVLQSEPFQKGTFDTLQYFEKELLLCQCFCQALYTSIRTEPVGGAGAAAKSSIFLPGRSDTPSQVVASASRFSHKNLSPLDSVSQRPSTAPVPKKMAAGTLTDDVLKQHRNQMIQGGNKSRVHPAVRSAASVAAAASAVKEKKSGIVPLGGTPTPTTVRVIDLIDHPQQHLLSRPRRSAVGVHHDRGDEQLSSTTTTHSSSSSASEEEEEKEKKLRRYPHTNRYDDASLLSAQSDPNYHHGHFDPDDDDSYYPSSSSHHRRRY